MFSLSLSLLQPGYPSWVDLPSIPASDHNHPPFVLTAPVSYVSTSETISARPDLGSAGKVVSGGRALKNKETFAEIMEPLADALGAGESDTPPSSLRSEATI